MKVKQKTISLWLVVVLFCHHVRDYDWILYSDMYSFHVFFSCVIMKVIHKSAEHSVDIFESTLWAKFVSHMAIGSTSQPRMNSCCFSSCYICIALFLIDINLLKSGALKNIKLLSLDFKIYYWITARLMNLCAINLRNHFNVLLNWMCEIMNYLVVMFSAVEVWNMNLI